MLFTITAIMCNTLVVSTVIMNYCYMINISSSISITSVSISNISIVVILSTIVRIAVLIAMARVYLFSRMAMVSIAHAISERDVPAALSSEGALLLRPPKGSPSKNLLTKLNCC